MNKIQTLKDWKPVRRCLKGWAFSDLVRRKAKVERAKTLVSTLPEYVRQRALEKIATIEAFCDKD
jgi:hypothetical protein